MANKGIKVLIINGPNLNLLGTREPKLYGNRAFGKFLSTLQEEYEDIELEYFQSNHEGELIDRIHQARSGYDGVVFYKGGVSQTTKKIRDYNIAGYFTKNLFNKKQDFWIGANFRIAGERRKIHSEKGL
jgi:3-dehydroquinate dehydratase